MADEILSMEQILTTAEGLYFDRKSGKISPKDLADVIAAFANANGGTVVVGVSDRCEIEGLRKLGENKINSLEKAAINHLKQLPICDAERRKIFDSKGDQDVILIFSIKPSRDYIIRNQKDEVFFRQGDSCVKLNAMQIRSLEYERHERIFESEPVAGASLNDIDEDVVRAYKERIGAKKLSDEEILQARGFLREQNGEKLLTNAGVLLFCKNPTIFLPSARIRVIKFEGSEFGVGADYNVIKDKTFDSCLIKSIEQVRDFITSQLRDFTRLNEDGIFETVPEYPEFAWYEGLVNAVAHRDYSNSGEHILISIYDDHLTIKSPGKLPGFITLKTMTTKRYSRNPQIARVLSEFGVVRELNEGVKRIYKEMESFFLKDPVYSEPDNSSVELTLYNNIVIRGRRKAEHIAKIEGWETLTPVEQEVIRAIYDKGSLTSAEAMKITGRSKPTTVKLLNRLAEKHLIVWTGTTRNDKYGQYRMR